MQTGTRLHGFEVTRVREIEELGGRLVEMTHEKTGAQLCWLDRPEENKAFCIAFKTIPEDSTGVFHILEHSVLCGSDKYPVKEPFVELLKTSVQTFLNAMTFPDKTVYPFSSRNDKDYLNLMDIYLDAVFHPAIYHRPEIFRQEGWRYENPDTEPVYQGVVLNEMKGAFSSPRTLLENAMNELLFPDNCYRFVSGGDPERIPDLSYEQFLAMHRKYYHPSNARISLVGSVDLDQALEKLDSFLRDYERREADFSIPMQAAGPARTVERPYEIGPEEPLEQRTILCCGRLWVPFYDRKRNYAASILADYLAGDNDAPLKRAVLQAGLAQDFSLSLHDGIQQSWFSWDAFHTDPEKLPELRRVIRETLEQIAARGLEPQRLRACCNAYAFGMRDHDNGFGPRSLNEALDMLDTWNYGGDPAEGLMVEDVLAQLCVRPDPEYFAELMRELLLEQAHCVTLILTPSHSLGAEKAEREAARLRREAAAWTEAQRQELTAQAEALAAWQQTPDSPEAIASIPMLQRSDLKSRPDPLPMEEGTLGEIPVLRHKAESKLVRFKLIFSLAALKLEELPAVELLSRLLGVAGTEFRSAEQLQLQVKERIGKLELRPVVYAGSDPEHCKPLLAVSFVCLAEEAEAAGALAAEILTRSCYTDEKLLRDLLQQANMELQQSLSAAGHQYAMTRMNAYFSAHGVAREYLGGTELAHWMKRRSSAGEAELAALLAQMKALAGRIFTARRLTLSVSDNCPASLLGALCSAFPRGEEQPPREMAYAPLGIRQEGIVIPAAVGYACRGSRLTRCGLEYHGSLPILANVLNFAYLWSEIRVQGGAYGCGFVAGDEGDAGYYTYRDPKPERSLDVMKGAAEFLRSFCASNPDLSGFVLGAVSTLDPLLNEESRMRLAESRWFKGLSYERVCRRYRELVNTDCRDLLALLPILEQISADNAACVTAGAPLLDACGDRLRSRVSV